MSLDDDVREYTAQLRKGKIQKAYKGILTFMSGLRTHMAARYPEVAAGGLYAGAMDMTYFALTPPELKKRNLKIAVVYLHVQNRFEVWLSGSNRKCRLRPSDGWRSPIHMATPCPGLSRVSTPS